MTARDPLSRDAIEQAITAALATAAERERLRLRDLVLAFAENKMHRSWLAELAQLFEVTP